MKHELRIALINPQGHVRWKNPPIAGHPDTGGQIVYILELSRELASLGYRIDIFTRYFDDPDWPGYTSETEEYPGHPGLRIIRIKCGPRNKFLNKEELWPHIREFTGGIRSFYSAEGTLSDIISSHYGDAGLAAAMLKKDSGLPYVHTGHSLGGKKMDNLGLTPENFEEITREYQLDKRIAAERISFRNARSIVASTKEEINSQYAHRVYRGAVADTSKFRVIPPGIDPAQFFPFSSPERDEVSGAAAAAKLRGVLERDITPDRLSFPCVFSAARFDAKKNPAGLMEAYANSRKLRSSTNLLIIAGNVDDPLKEENKLQFSEHERCIIDEIAAIIEKHGLEGSVCLSRGFDFTQMPYVYRYAGRNNWIFVNPALHEPFGLTVIEAMASGVPVVATSHGGPSEILGGGEYGVLVDATTSELLMEGIEKLLDRGFWKEMSDKGIKRVKERFTWETAALSYSEVFGEMMDEKPETPDYEVPVYFADPEGRDGAELADELRRLYFEQGG